MANGKKYGRPEEIAQLVGVTVRRIQQLTQDGVISSRKPPGKSQGNARVYDIELTLAALVKHYRKLADGRGSSNDAMEEEKLLKLAAQREQEEIKLQRMRGELHHSADIEQVFGDMLSRLRTSLLSLPLTVAPNLTEMTDMHQISEVIERRLHQCLSELSEFNFDDLVMAMDLEDEDNEDIEDDADEDDI